MDNASGKVKSFAGLSRQVYGRYNALRSDIPAIITDGTKTLESGSDFASLELKGNAQQDGLLELVHNIAFLVGW